MGVWVCTPQTARDSGSVTDFLGCAVASSVFRPLPASATDPERCNTPLFSNLPGPYHVIPPLYTVPPTAAGVEFKILRPADTAAKRDLLMHTTVPGLQRALSAFSDPVGHPADRFDSFPVQLPVPEVSLTSSTYCSFSSSVLFMFIS